MVRRSSASPSPAPQTKLRLSGPFCYTHQCFICRILQRGITELFLVIVTDFLNNCYIIKIRKCKSHGYLIPIWLFAFCFLLFSMTTLLQLGVNIKMAISCNLVLIISQCHPQVQVYRCSQRNELRTPFQGLFDLVVIKSKKRKRTFVISQYSFNKQITSDYHCYGSLSTTRESCALINYKISYVSFIARTFTK